MKNSKYIKVSAKDRLPEKEGDYFCVIANGPSIMTCRSMYFERFKGITHWLQEVPDYEDEMKEMLEKVMNESDEYNYIRSWDGARKEQETGTDKIHPHQKPIALYKWLLNKYAKSGYKILDTHLGSASIAIACHDYGFDLTACEIDTIHFNNAVKRINNHVSQLSIFP